MSGLSEEASERGQCGVQRYEGSHGFWVGRVCLQQARAHYQRTHASSLPARVGQVAPMPLTQGVPDAQHQLPSAEGGRSWVKGVACG